MGRKMYVCLKGEDTAYKRASKMPRPLWDCSRLSKAKQTQQQVQHKGNTCSWVRICTKGEEPLCFSSKGCYWDNWRDFKGCLAGNKVLIVSMLFPRFDCLYCDSAWECPCFKKNTWTYLGEIQHPLSYLLNLQRQQSLWNGNHWEI